MTLTSPSRRDWAKLIRSRPAPGRTPTAAVPSDVTVTRSPVISVTVFVVTVFVPGTPVPESGAAAVAGGPWAPGGAALAGPVATAAASYMAAPTGGYFPPP